MSKHRSVNLNRWGGLGDVCMMLAAARALAVQGHTVSVTTNPAYESLAMACKHVRRVNRPIEAEIQFDLCDASHGICGEHQALSYLKHTGLHFRPEDVELDLSLHENDFAGVDVLRMDRAMGQSAWHWVLLHPGKTDPNRTWPVSKWNELAEHLTRTGALVVWIGNRHAEDGRGVQDVVVDHNFHVDMRDQLTLLQLVALMRSSKLLVSADSGPIQLAGAAPDMGIVGIYSVVKGAWRLPRRNQQDGWNAITVEPTCSHAPCYRKMFEEGFWGKVSGPLSSGEVSLGEVFSQWCPARMLHGEPFQCMSSIDSHTVYQACRMLMKLPPFGPVRVTP